MLDQLKNMKQLAGMLGNLGDMKEKMESLQQELAEKRAVGESPDGSISVTVNGNFEVLSIRRTRGEGPIEDVEAHHEQLQAAVNNAMHRVRDLAKQQMMGML